MGPYELLGVRSDDDLVVVRAAWRRAVRAHHPDGAGGGDVAMFLAIQDAYRQITASRQTITAPHTMPRAEPDRSATPPASQPYDYDLADGFLVDDPQSTSSRTRRWGGPFRTAVNDIVDLLVDTPAADRPTSPPTGQAAAGHHIGTSRRTQLGATAAAVAVVATSGRLGYTALAADSSAFPMLPFAPWVFTATATPIVTALAAQRRHLETAAAVIALTIPEAIPLIAPLAAIAALVPKRTTP